MAPGTQISGLEISVRGLMSKMEDWQRLDEAKAASVIVG